MPESHAPIWLIYTDEKRAARSFLSWADGVKTQANFNANDREIASLQEWCGSQRAVYDRIAWVGQ